MSAEQQEVKPGVKYPEYEHYPVGWKALLQRRLESEGRWGRANRKRLAYIKREKCDKDASWKWMCDTHPPVGLKGVLLEDLQKEAIKAEQRSKVRKQNGKAEEMRKYRAGMSWVPEMQNEQGLEDAVAQRTISSEERVNKEIIPVEDEVRWVMQHLNERGVKMKDAPSPCAYQIWLFAIENPQEMVKFYFDMAKKSQSTESKDWVKDDEELGELLGELRAQVPGARNTERAMEVGSENSSREPRVETGST